MQHLSKNIFKKFSALLVTAALLLTVAFPRVFTKTVFFNIYALEWVSLAFIIFHLHFFIGRNLRRSLKLLLPAILFAIVGIFRFFIDLQTWSSDVPLSRGLQYGVIFIYPVVWMFIGQLYRDVYRRSLATLILGILICDSLMHLTFSYHSLNTDPMMQLNGKNLSLGPLLALIPIALYFTARKKLHEIGSIILSILTFLPFWILMQDEFNRTSLALTLIMYALAPLIFIKSGLKRMLKFYGVTALIFLIGTSASLSYRFRHGTDLAVKAKVITAFQHGDDRSEHDATSKEPKFQFRSRWVWWSDALDQWREKPLYGVGFNVNVPRYIKPGVLNDGVFKGVEHEFVSLHGKPIAGPHNSYLTILARLGIVGASLFCILLLQVLFSAFSIARFLPSKTFKDALVKLTLIFLPLNGFLFSCIGLGLESPYNCVLAWFFCGIAVAISKDEGIHAQKNI